MRSLPIIVFSAAGLLSAVSIPAFSYDSVVMPAGFSEMVRRSDAIIEGRVVKLESVWNKKGTSLPRMDVGKASQPPAVEPPPSRPAQESQKSAAEPAASPAQPDPAKTNPAAPVGLGVEGGRMIFTRVTFELRDRIKGTSASPVQFAMAGGSLDDRTVVVAGMPKLIVGERYVLFLRNGYQRGADPFVGVNQGVFHIVADPKSGQDVVLNANQDFVLGIEDEQVVLRRNAQASGGPVRQLQPAPKSSDPAVKGRTSPQVLRYWKSEENPMTSADFIAAIRARLTADTAR